MFRLVFESHTGRALGADSEEKHEPVSDIDTAVVDGLKALDPERPIREVDIFAATLPTLKFSPGVHVNYAETVLPMRDGLPKLKDFPKEFGGSGEVVPE